MADLPSLKNKRGAAKAAITRIKTFLENKPHLLVEELECRLSLLEAHFKQFLHLQESIVALDPTDTNAGEIEEIYCSVKAKLLAQMGVKRQQSLDESNLLIPSGTGTSSHQNHHSKLPNDIEKFIHLKSCLKSEALQMIQGLEISSDNYRKALQLLKERYDNKYLIFESHIGKLFEIPEVSKINAEQVKHLVDNVNLHFKSMQSIGSSEEILHSLLIYIVKNKLDVTSKTKWEESITISSIPSWDIFFEFLQKRCQQLDCFEATQCSSKSLYQNSRKMTTNKTALTTLKSFCAECQDTTHSIHKCSKFLKLSALDRFRKVKQLRLCLNCLHKGHTIKSCLSSRCRICNSLHHTLLHRFENSINSNTKDTHPSFQPVTPITPATDSSPISKTLHTCSTEFRSDQVLLATAVLLVKTKSNTYIPIRALLDSASQLNLMTESLSRKLQLPRKDIIASINGVGETNLRTSYAINTTLKSRINDFQSNVEAWVIPQITSNHPETKIDINQWKIPNNIVLADPQFNIPKRIDMLIGAECFLQLLAVGQIQLGEGLPLLQKTLLGWIVTGRCIQERTSFTTCHLTLTNDPEIPNSSLQKQMERFWEIENVTTEQVKESKEHIDCETHFKNSVKQDIDGRFVVQLPFKESTSLLGESYRVAYSSLMRLERKLNKNTKLKEQYSQFMTEYVTLNHMEEKASSTEIKYFIPHHCVLKPDSSSTKLRIVFNASSPTSTGYSLNDILMTGPTVQDDLYAIAIRFRCNKYAVTADISKMYRQIWVENQDRNYLGIIWKDFDSNTLKHYVLKTVTYGTTCAPYQATRCLIELANRYKSQYPLGSQAIQHNMYVDDFLFSTDSIQELYDVKHQIETILAKAKFDLKKWASNYNRFLEDIPLNDREPLRNLKDYNAIKTLGILWEPQTDNFHFNWSFSNNSNKITKRIILSELSSLYDPLGLCNPVIVIAKIFMQQLWLLKIDWDESLPLEYHTRWETFRNQIHNINLIKVPRKLFDSSNGYELHGFSDASMKAYGCCIYARCITDNGIKVTLITSKSRVAPLKSLSLPRLELCAALLLSNLIVRIKEILSQHVNITLWTDSEIVLHWINGEPSSWTTFVSNRIAKIQRLVKIEWWRHVDSKNNPADIVSRGATPKELVNSFWFSGPKFLMLPHNQWPQSNKFKFCYNDVPERKLKKSVHHTTTKSQSLVDLIENHKYVNNFTKLCRVFAFTLRFKCCLKSNKPGPQLPIITVEEMNQAISNIIYNIQQVHFAEEIAALKSSKVLNAKSRIKSLSPFLDDGCPQLLRVGGRLQHADIPYDRKFPILLPDHPFSKSYIVYLHSKLFHAGIQALIAASREKYWIIGAKRLITTIVRKCIHCNRYKPRIFHQIMGNLPSDRVNPSRPFSISGVDFCGPITTTLKARGHQLRKSYIAVFICFAVKAVHLEVVSDLSSDAFIAALKRFVARRGLCHKLYCDNATNFVGARTKLTELFNLFFTEPSKSKILQECINENITFEFIPPRSPHFGGLWEAAVKSAKYHLHRILHNSILTFEELSTLTAQIEAILNSRPISAMSTDPSDENALTPGHFLIGGNLCAIPEPDYTAERFSYLKRWQYVTSLQQHFWKRWSREYIPTLQQRYKWKASSPNIKIGTLVLIADDNQPPQKWSMGRIINTIPGSDGHTRVVEVKTKNNIIRRAIHKLAPLPIEETC